MELKNGTETKTDREWEVVACIPVRNNFVSILLNRL